MTIVEHIISIRTEVMKEIGPHRAVELLQKLSALIGMATDEWIEAEMSYNIVFKSLSIKHEKISEARVNAKASNEYKKKLITEAQIESINKLIDSLKYLIKIKTNEMEKSRYQT